MYNATVQNRDDRSKRCCTPQAQRYADAVPPVRRSKDRAEERETKEKIDTRKQNANVSKRDPSSWPTPTLVSPRNLNHKVRKHEIRVQNPHEGTYTISVLIGLLNHLIDLFVRQLFT